ncbi:toprim domain-containing protein [Candidatus Binatus sp.]|uniref:toprim domain-containing protein n=1 Tax=Candidatus Binatus sp. TaxID=2811406 RepID=UPI003BAE744D
MDAKQLRPILAILEGARPCAGGYTALCPSHPDKRSSLSIRIGSNGRLLLKCFAGCSFERIVAALGSPRVARFNAVPSAPSADEDLDRRRRIDFARSIWNSSFPITGPPVEKLQRGRTIIEKYFRSRGITIDAPLTLRVRCSKHPTGPTLPTLVAAVVNEADGIVAIHRTFLDDNGKKTKLEPAKAALGPIKGGAVRLAVAGERLVLCEGIETGLSVLQATGLPVWAALGTSNLINIELPNVAREIIIAADGDRPGERAAKQAAYRFVREGRHVRIANAERGRDFNDYLMGAT